ncbi:MAG: hypothetical protein JNK84_12525 [Phreatobacter sp.]|uniref:hypothetical protein n=1 Tax=Phreatobacter sp. TaxID=1966341 RepID=UPI001A434FB6|nr:hypothetical protein [Phreatobacter sp.]MBL8569890.1 hypothetical protein [Phreatobacter sp.]
MASECDVGLSFRNAIHRIKRLKLKKLDFLTALQSGVLNAFIRLDARHRFDIPALFWEKYDTAHFSFSPDAPDFHLSLFDLRDAAIHDIERLRAAVEQKTQVPPQDLPFLGSWFAALIEDWRHSEQIKDLSFVYSLLLSEYFRRGNDLCDALVSQSSLKAYEREQKPKSNAGRFAVPGPDAMWEAVLVLVVSRKDKSPTIDEIYETMDGALSDKDRKRTDEDGNLLYTEELLHTRAKQIRKALTAAFRDSGNSTN